MQGVPAETIAAFLQENELTVYLVLFGRESLTLGRALQADVQEYIDDHYAQAHEPRFNSLRREAALRREEAAKARYSADYDAAEYSVCTSARPEPTEALPKAAKPTLPKIRPKAAKPDEQREEAPKAAKPAAPRAEASKAAKPAELASAAFFSAAESTRALDRIFTQMDESFQQMLLRKIDESGMTDAQCYKKANVDRKLFSKIRGDVQYRPSKATAIAFAVALELDLQETRELLMKAGYALSRSSKFDVIIRYFIEHRRYDIFEINEVLFYYDQSLLGA